MYTQNFRSTGYSWNNGAQGSQGMSLSGYNTSNANTNGYDPANPGYSASVSQDYVNPGYTAFMGGPSSHQPQHIYSQQLGNSGYGQSYSQNPSGSSSYLSRTPPWKKEHPSRGGRSKGSNPKGNSYSQTFPQKKIGFQNKPNQSPPKSASARKLTQSSQKRSAGTVISVRSVETGTAPNRIIPAKQGSSPFKKPKGSSSTKSSTSQKKKDEMNGYGSYGRGAYQGFGGKKSYGGKRRVFKKRDNDHDDIPFTPIPEGAPFAAFPISTDNIHCFHGFQSVFTTQHMFPVLIDDSIYESCDHYYQIEKTKQLCGTTSEKMTATVRDSEGRRLDGKVGFRSHEEKGFSTLARELIRLSNVPKEKVEEWRHTKGLEVMQKALAAKVAQCPELREALRATGDKILIHCFPGDAIYGSGTRITGIKAWCDEMQKNEGKLMVPMHFPLDQETVQQAPVVGKGRNILGVIMMQLRNQVMSNDVDIKDMSIVFDALRGGPGGDASKDILDGEGHGFSIGGGSIQPPIGTAP